MASKGVVREVGVPGSGFDSGGGGAAALGAEVLMVVVHHGARPHLPHNPINLTVLGRRVLRPGDFTLHFSDLEGGVALFTMVLAI